MEDPELIHNFKGHKDTITGLHFNPSQKQVASSSLDGSVMLWNWNTDKKAGVYIVFFNINPPPLL